MKDIGKVWYRTSLLNSTLFAVDANGAVVAHMIYDPWGKPLTETYIDTNRSGLDNLNNYTGYSWDETLELYYAQNRFYDADNHRFTQEDTVKDGANWYVYCGNEPTLNIDMTGLCFFDANGNWRHDNWEYSGGYQIKKDPKNFMLQYGSSGYAVSELQRLLVKYGYLTSSTDIDGSFGSKTKSAVTAFQRTNSLSVDGIVGPKTWAKFFSENVKKAGTAQTTQQQKPSATTKPATDYQEKLQCKDANNTTLIQWFQETTGYYNPLLPGEMYYVDYSESASFSIKFAGIGKVAGLTVLFNEDKYCLYDYTGRVSGASFGTPVMDRTASMGIVSGVYEVVDFEGESTSIYTYQFVAGGGIYSEGVSSRTGKTVASKSVWGKSLLAYSAGSSSTYYTARSTDWVEKDYIKTTGDNPYNDRPSNSNMV